MNSINQKLKIFECSIMFITLIKNSPMKIQVDRLSIIIFFLCQSFFAISQKSDIQNHTTLKGESLYQIAKRYNTNLDAIYDLNPDYRNQILKIGDIVRVPNNPNNQEENFISDDGYLLITIVSGDTKYAISKKYEVTIATLEALNPQIVSMLLIGQRVRIPKNKSSVNVVQNQVPLINNYNNSGDYLVKKGETLWGIAQSNNIVVSALIEANKDRLDGVLKAGQYLRIPNETTSNNIALTNNNSNTNNDLVDGFYHIVKPGETKYGLSKKYQISIKDLEEKNPQIIPMLMIGQRLIIKSVDNQLNNNENPIVEVSEPKENEVTDSNESRNETTVLNENSSVEYVDYVVQSQETLFGLAKKASMTKEDFLKLNPSLADGVNVGMTIKMPKTTTALPENISTSEDLKPQEPLNSLEFNSNLVDYPANVSYTNISNNLDLNQQVNVAFIFSEEVAALDEFSLTSNEEKIALEQYKGVLLAIDTLKTLGAKINASFLNTKSNDFNSKSWQATFLKADIIFGNYNSFRFEEVLLFAKEHNKKIIVPTKQAILEEDSNVVYAYPNELHQKIFMINYLKSLDANILVVTDAIDSDNANFLRNYDASIKFAPLDSRGIVNNDRFRLMFDKNRINFVVLDTDKNSLIISSTNFLLGESNNYGIRLALFKSRELINSPDISDIRLKVLQLVYPSVINPNEQQITKFKELYINKYDKSPSKEAKISFDIALDVILRMIYNQKNDDFTTLNTMQEHMKFQYQTYKNSYWNAGIFIIKYE